MTPQRWVRIKEIFNSALERDEEDRPAFLARACGPDEDLCREVQSLLQEHSPTAVLESPLRPPDLSGRTITHYRILAKLGAGGMGVVYKAEDTKLGRMVALKFLPPRASVSEEQKARFVREAKAAAAIDHPNICTVYEIEEADGQTFLAMTYIDGPTLKEKSAERPLKLEEAVRIAAEAAQGLQAAHRKGIVHRDIKSANIMLGPGGRVVITDFGLAHLEGETRITQTGASMGTPAYMSPEQLRGDNVDSRSDIWSLGVVLYEMVSGRLPFPADRPQSLAQAVLTGQPEPLTALRSGVPLRLEWIVTKMLSKSPDERYQSADELAVDLRALSRELAAGPEAGKSSRPGRPRLFWAASAAAAAVIAAAWLFVSTDSKPEVPVKVVPLTSYTGLELSPAFSPDGNQIAFTWGDDKNPDDFDIYLKMIGDARHRRLTTTSGKNLFPAWSPDGLWIAFVRRMSADKVGVFLISPLGGPERKLVETSVPKGFDFYCRPAWSPDGKFLVVGGRDATTGRYRLSLLSVDTLEKTRLTEPPPEFLGDRDPAFSPDGRNLAFVRGTSDLGEVYTLPLNGDYSPGGEPKRLTFEHLPLYGIAWTADGQDVVFSSVDIQAGLWRMAASGAGLPERLEYAGDGAYWPAISADGRRLAYSRLEDDENIWRIDRNGSGISWRPPERFQAISSTRRDFDAAFSPDGQRIAFVSDRSGSLNVWVSDRDGSTPLQLTSLGRHSANPRWSPDGGRIALESDASGNWDVYVVGADGGRPQRLTHSRSDETGANWSRDGRWIYFSSNRGGNQQIWKMPANGGEALQVTRNGGHMASESADPSALFYTKYSTMSPLYMIPLDGGEEKQVIESVFEHSFVVTNEGIYFMAPPHRGRGSSVRFFDFTSGKTSLVAQMDALACFQLTVSPDARAILYTQCDRVGSDLMLVENFR